MLSRGRSAPLVTNGKEEFYLVDSAVFHERFHGIEAHYGVKIRRKGSFPKNTGGHYIHVTGHNARVPAAASAGLPSGLTFLAPV